MINTTFEQISSPEELKKLTNKEYKLALKEAKICRDSIYDMYGLEYLNNYNMMFYIAMTRLTSPLYFKNTQAFKNIVGANVMFSNNEDMIKLLLHDQINFQTLQQMISTIMMLKKISTPQQIVIIDNLIKQLADIVCNGLEIEQNEAVTTLIINKLVEIITFFKDLYQDLEQKEKNKQYLFHL